MGTLYVVGVPAGNPDDLTHRARRVLESVRLWVAADPSLAQSRLAAYGAALPATPIAALQDAVVALSEGDVALVVDGTRPVLRDDEREMVSMALDNEFPVMPIPGPALPLTALVVSGLPADSFVYVGHLPEAAGAREALIGAVAAERRTLLFLARSPDAKATLHDLSRALGDRPLVIVPSPGFDLEPPWRGTLQAACDEIEGVPGGDVLAVVVGGATEEPVAWDEARLAAAIEQRVARGEGAKEISQVLAEVSGWSRREIYRRATGRTGTRADW